jgi:hypothetical protein
MNLAQQAPCFIRTTDWCIVSFRCTTTRSQTQAGLTAQQQLAQAQATEEQQRLSQLGSGITSLIAGYPAQTQTQMTPSPSGLATGLGTASTLAGIYRLYKGQYG